MNYREALAYLYSFANYELSAITPRTDLKLSRMRQLLDLAGNPQQRFRSILVAGTKGKGSTAAMLAAIAQAGGYKTGLYTTPHLNTHRERMRVNGRLIAEKEFVQEIEPLPAFLERYERVSELGRPTTYELGTFLAFEFFAQQAAELAVVEVGLGGRLDSTNVLDAEIAIIASISYDHTHILGCTLKAIAAEKAGIIKRQRPVVSAPQANEAMEVIRRVAHEREAALVTAAPPRLAQPCPKIYAGRPLPPRIGQSFALPGKAGSNGDEEEIEYSGEPAWVGMLGSHQLANAGLAIEAARILNIPDAAIRKGLAAVCWPGRLEVLSRTPLVVGDGAHNVDSMEKLASAVHEHFGYRGLNVIAGFSADKDVAGMAPVINELANRVILTHSHHPRAADPASVARFFPGSVTTPTLEQAIRELNDGSDEEMTLITGSLFLVGEARRHFGLVPPEEQDPF